MRPPARYLALVVALAACDAPAPEPPVAVVDGWTLTGERLADLLVLAQPLPLDSATVTGLVDEWVTRAALARFELGGGDLLAPEVAGFSLWMETREATLAAARAAAAGPDSVSAEEAGAEFEADSLRLFAHVLRRVDASTSPEERALQRRTAQEVLNSLRSGRSWPEVVARSEDAATRDASGLLGLMRVDELPLALQTVGRQLEPGQVSAVVESPQGYHVVYRPRYTDVASLYRELLQERVSQRGEARATLETLAALDLEVSDAAIARVRELAGRPVIPGDDQEPVLVWRDGQLGAGVLGRYLASLPDAARRALADSSDDDIAVALGQLAAREARLGRALERGVTPDPVRMAELEALHQEEVEAWRGAVPTSGGAEAARAALARYMDRLVARQSDTPPVPPVLRWWLLTDLEWSVDGESLGVATDRARALVQAAGEGSSPP